MMKARGVAIVVVGYPATPIVESRVRFCISASHTQEQLQYTLRCLDEVWLQNKAVLLERN